MDRDLFVFFSTPKNTPDGTEAKRCVDKLIETGIIKENDWDCHTSNTNSLAKNYNDVLKDDRVTGKILLLIHSDVIVDDLFVKEKLNMRFNKNKMAGMVGIAGGKQIYNNKKELQLWHQMTVPGKLQGEVTNNYGDDLLAQVCTTRFGGTGDRVIIADGCFMALNVDLIRKYNVTFDEECPSKFNFYDLNFCLRCYEKGVEVYVDPIHILHRSIGLTHLTEDFVLGNEFFKNNYIRKLWEPR